MQQDDQFKWIEEINATKLLEPYIGKNNDEENPLTTESAIPDGRILEQKQLLKAIQPKVSQHASKFQEKSQQAQTDNDK